MACPTCRQRTMYVTVAVRKHVMVAVSPHVTVPGRVCVSVSV